MLKTPVLTTTPVAPLQDGQKFSLREVLDSSRLFDGRQEIVIRHGGHDYRLRVTRQNKLILTK